MEPRFCYDPSQPISENDYVLLMDHIKRCFVVKVERNKFVKICKDKFRIDRLIGLNYGQIFTKIDNEWIPVSRSDDRYRSYWDLLDNEYEDLEDSEFLHTRDNRNFIDNTKSQKLTADDINEMKKNVNPSELITTIVENSDTFQSRTSMSKEKYIRRKEFRHLKMFEIRYCDLISVCESYFSGFPHKIGYLRFESLALMLHSANVQFGNRVIVFDHSLGLITGALAQRLQGTGKIYRLVTKGVSDKILHELGVNYFDNILSVDYDQVINYVKGNADGNVPDNPVSDVSQNLIQLDKDDFSLQKEDKEDDQLAKKRKKETLPGIYPLTKINYEDLSDVDLVIGNVSFNKCGKNNSVVNKYTFDLLQISNKYLKPDGKFILFGQHFQPLTKCYAILTKSNEYINVKLDEVFLREYQVKNMCTHPIINKSRPCCGFVLTSIKISPNRPS